MQLYRNRIEFGQDEGKMRNFSFQTSDPNLSWEELARPKYQDFVIEVSLRLKGAVIYVIVKNAVNVIATLQNERGSLVIIQS